MQNLIDYFPSTLRKPPHSFMSQMMAVTAIHQPPVGELEVFVVVIPKEGTSQAKPFLDDTNKDISDNRNSAKIYRPVFA